MKGLLMNNELSWVWNQVVVTYLGYYPGICMGRLRKTNKNLSKDGLSPDRDLNSRPREYETGMLSLVAITHDIDR
jgi:hypothetical protein